MTRLTIQLNDKIFQRIQRASKKMGKPVEAIVHEWIERFQEEEKEDNLIQDPFFKFEGFDSEAPADLSVNVDKYLYGDNG